MSIEAFSIVDVNPNDEIGGGGCLCDPSRKIGSCKGPFVVFQNAEVAGDPDAGLHNSPHAVLSLACAQGALKKLGGEALASGESALRSAKPDDYLDWDTLGQDEQAEIRELFPAGGPCKLLDGRRVWVPYETEVDGEPVTVHEPLTEASLEDLLLPDDKAQFEPGTRPGSLVPATPDQVDEPTPEPLDESEPPLEL